MHHALLSIKTIMSDKSVGKSSPQPKPCKKQSDSAKPRREQLNESSKGTRTSGPRSKNK